MMGCSTMRTGSPSRTCTDLAKRPTHRESYPASHAYFVYSHLNKFVRKIGKYGMGFRSCYHVTDTPQILSGSDLGILDPQKSTIADGGGKYNFITNTSSTDQLSGFDYFISPDAHNEPFNGTVIRLPLRNRSSEIRDKLVAPSEIRDLLVNFIATELNVVMLFLSHISSIEIHEIMADGKRCLAKAKVERDPPSSPQDNASDSTSDSTISLKPISKTYKCTVTIIPESGDPTSTTWRTLHAEYPLQISERLLQERLAYDPNSPLLATTLASNKLLPHVGLAIPLLPQAAPRTSGRLYTYLPLPLYTGFPVHVHGLFALDQARHHLRSEEDGINHHSSDRYGISRVNQSYDLLSPGI
jgi:hypothetical protein